MSNAEETDSTTWAKRKWKFLIWFQVVMVVGFLNPWSSVVRLIAVIVIGIEVLLLVFVSVPVFLYQLFIRKKTLSESIAISIDAAIPFLWYTF